MFDAGGRVRGCRHPAGGPIVGRQHLVTVCTCGRRRLARALQHLLLECGLPGVSLVMSAVPVAGVLVARANPLVPRGAGGTTRVWVLHVW